jgi:transglutaminase-like putative cysteine protease
VTIRPAETEPGHVGRTKIEAAWLEPTWFIDSGSAEVTAFASEACEGVSDAVDMAVALFVAVRDGFRYDPYVADRVPESFRASSVTESTANWCVPKSVLLTAAARNRGIPARLGFADVRNHLSSERLLEQMGTDIFAWHGYSELLLDGRWFKLSSAFNIEMCDKFGVKPLEFDGTCDALMHAFDAQGNRHMEYVNQHGSFDDLPLDRIFAAFDEIYTGLGSAAAPERDTSFD